MPRRPRLQLAGTPLHVTQRGVNRCAIFVEDLDRRQFYELLCEAMTEHQIGLHAYIFMGNHVHLLLTPEDSDALSRTMRNVGQCHVRLSTSAIRDPARPGRGGSNPAWSIPTAT